MSSEHRPTTKEERERWHLLKLAPGQAEDQPRASAQSEIDIFIARLIADVDRREAQERLRADKETT